MKMLKVNFEQALSHAVFAIEQEEKRREYKMKSAFLQGVKDVLNASVMGEPIVIEGNDQEELLSAAKNAADAMRNAAARIDAMVAKIENKP